MSAQLVEALAAVAADLRAVGKDAQNREQNFRFRGIDSLVDAVHPLLAKHQVVIAPFVEERTEEEHRVKSGAVWRHVVMRVRWDVYGPDGEHLSAVTYGEGLDGQDKATNKAQSQAFKYLLNQLFTVPFSDGDPDAESPPERVDTEPPPSEQQMSQLKEIRSSLAERDEDDEQRQAGRAIWSSVTGRAGQYPATYAQASELLTRLAEAGIYVPGGEPFDDPNDDEDAS